MNRQTPQVIEPEQSLVNTPGASHFDVQTALDHIGREILSDRTTRNIVFSQENSYVKFETGVGRAKCWVVVKLEPCDEYSIEFHKSDLRAVKTVRGQMVMNENFGQLTRLALYERIPLENLREIIRDYFA